MVTWCQQGNEHCKQPHLEDGALIEEGSCLNLVADLFPSLFLPPVTFSNGPSTLCCNSLGIDVSISLGKEFRETNSVLI